jgi:hypothetical protein
MNKKALFLSVSITTFILVLVGGVFSVYRAFASTGVQMTQAQPVIQAPLSTAGIATTMPAIQQVTPEQAAAIAAAFIGQKNVFAVESAVLDGVTVYKVTFSSGAIVYVDMDGKILRVDTLVQYSNNQSSQPSIPPVIVEHSDDDEGDEGD